MDSDSILHLLIQRGDYLSGEEMSATWASPGRQYGRASPRCGRRVTSSPPHPGWVIA